ncbi:MAG: SPOR domain-containing protein, partial [Deltaproteobacteria bacterium]|nr:SPOR domain-containing protein [Deltaproteobacteria bacterium]
MNRPVQISETAKPAPESVAQIPAPASPGPPSTETEEPARLPAATKPAPGPAVVPAPGPAARPSEAAKPKGERYLLVAGSYASQKQAQALLQKLKKDNFKATLASRSTGGKTQYLVQLGPVTGPKAAEDLARRLKSQEKITPRIVKMAAKTKANHSTKPA